MHYRDSGEEKENNNMKYSLQEGIPGPAIKKTCTWDQHAVDFGVYKMNIGIYKTDCGMSSYFFDIHWLFCPYCSNKIIRKKGEHNESI